MYISKERRFTTVKSHVNSNESDNFNASNRVNVIETSNIPHINIQNNSPFNTIITLKY